MTRKPVKPVSPAEEPAVLDATIPAAGATVPAAAAVVSTVDPGEDFSQCAYGASPPSNAVDDEQKETQETAFPLRTYCVCKSESHTQEELDQGYKQEWRTCASPGCKAMFHPQCCATISWAHGLRSVTCDAEHMLCPKHHKELQTAHLKQRILLQHLLKARIKYLEEQAVKWRNISGKEQQDLGDHKLRVCAIMTDIDISVLMTSIPVTEGGFAQRNVAAEQASTVENLIRAHGYNILAGNLALVEIPYTDAEVEELKAQNLLPKDFVPPQPLVEMDTTCKDGSQVFVFSDPLLRMSERRFAIIDGNNRIIGLIRICADNVHFLKNTCVNAYLVDINIHDALAVQLASMKCNTLSHAHIEDTLGDRLAQYVSVLTIFRKMFKQSIEKKGKQSRNAPKQVDVVNWIQKNAADLVDLLPAESKHSTVTFDKQGEAIIFKTTNVTSWVRLAMKASSHKGFVSWLQQKFAAHAIGKPHMTKGQLKVFTHNFIKMDAVWDSGEPIKFLEARSRQIDRGIQMANLVRQWTTERRARYNEYMGYNAEPMACAAKVMEAIPQLSAQLLAHLATLAVTHDKDNDVLALIPSPLKDFPQHKLYEAHKLLCDGDLDFDVYCALWNFSTPSEAGAGRKLKQERLFLMPDAANFNIDFYPRILQDAYVDMTRKMQKLVQERKRAAAEAERNAQIEAKRQEALKEAARKLEEETQAARMSALATAAVAATITPPATGRSTRSSATKAPVMKTVVDFFFLFCLLLL